MKLFYLKFKFYLIVILLLVIYLIGCRFLVWPRVNEFLNIQKQIEVKNQELAKVNNQRRQIQEKADEYHKLTEQLEQFDKLVPKDKAESDLFAQVDALTQETGVKVSSISFAIAAKKLPVSRTQTTTPTPTTTSTSTTNSIFQKAKVTLDARGPLDSVKNFIDRLTTLDRLISIDAINFSASEKEYTANITANVYYNPKK